MLHICPPHQEGWKRVSKFFIWAGACTGTDVVLEQKMHYLFLYRNIYSTCSHSSITNIFLRQHFILKNLSYHRRHTRNLTFVHVSNKRCKGILSVLVCFGYRWQGLVVGGGLCEKRPAAFWLSYSEHKKVKQLPKTQKQIFTYFTCEKLNNNAREFYLRKINCD